MRALSLQGVHREIDVIVIDDRKRYLEPEAAAFTRRALHADRAAHRLGKLATDGKTKSGAAVFAGGRSIGLGERLEYVFQRCLGQAGRPGPTTR